MFQVGQNHWARDFVFVFGDDYIEGVEAFLATYHGLAGKSESVRSDFTGDCINAIGCYRG
jgi:hypothetical protein